MRVLLLFIAVFLSVPSFAQYLDNNLGSAAVGVTGSVFTHESGHALTAMAFGYKITHFRPFPSKIAHDMPDGSTQDKWVLGFVRSTALDGPSTDFERGWIGAMGSGTNVLMVLALSPLLPEAKGFGAQALDDMLVFDTFDMPAYILSDTLGFAGTGDWARVSKAFNIHLGWLLAGSIAESLLLNSYRMHFRDQAPFSSPLRNIPAKNVALTFGF